MTWLRRGVHSLLFVALVPLTGCTEFYVGTPSLSYVSAAPAPAHYVTVGSVVAHSECTSTWLVLIGGGQPPSHEVAIAKLLAQTEADVLLDAQLTTDRRQFILYKRTCATVRGQPARLASAS